MYSLIQAARQIFLKFKNVLEVAGFKQSEAEPCLCYKAVESYFVLVVVHIDDCYIICKPDLIQQVICDIEAVGLKLQHQGIFKL
jgi:hypothetical protein